MTPALLDTIDIDLMTDNGNDREGRRRVMWSVIDELVIDQRKPPEQRRRFSHADKWEAVDYALTYLQVLFADVAQGRELDEDTRHYCQVMSQGIQIIRGVAPR